MKTIKNSYTISKIRKAFENANFTKQPLDEILDEIIEDIIYEQQR